MSAEPDGSVPNLTRQQQSLLLSVHPVYANHILSGQKTAEIRRSRPNISPGSFVYIYASAPSKSIIGVFQVAEIITEPVNSLWRTVNAKALVTKEQFESYLYGISHAHAILIAHVLKLVNPISLDYLRLIWPGFRPPQSFRYLSPTDSRAFGLMSAVHQALASR